MYLPVVDDELAHNRQVALIHENVGSNVAVRVIHEKGSYLFITGEAHSVVMRRFSSDHGNPVTMENHRTLA
jgi:hypothetical protein